MSGRQPTFRERIRLLQIAASEAASIAEVLTASDNLPARLREIAEIIDAEVARMESAAQRWEQKPQRRNTKTAPKGTAITK
jgi:hypothetical protein